MAEKGRLDAAVGHALPLPAAATPPALAGEVWGFTTEKLKQKRSQQEVHSR